MSRPNYYPAFPLCPGEWLALYRLRGAGSNQSHDFLGKELGVSGATIRRWENGNTAPSERDLQRFASVCELSPIEFKFLTRAFKADTIEQPPDRVYCEQELYGVLNTPNPAFVVDSLCYLRAMNGGFGSLFPSRPPSLGSNMISALFTLHLNRRRGSTRHLLRWLLYFWFSTSRLCGTEAYRRLLLELRTLDGFEDAWRGIALNGINSREPMNAPYFVEVPEIGAFRVLQANLVLPPTYLLKEYVPVSEQSESCLHSVSESKLRPSIKFAKSIHWLEH